MKPQNKTNQASNPRNQRHIYPPLSTQLHSVPLSETRKRDVPDIFRIIINRQNNHRNNPYPNNDPNKNLNAKDRFNQRFPHLNLEYFDLLTRYILNTMYPKYCPDCNTKMIKTVSTRENIIRCPVCHHQSSITVMTPLHHLKIPIWVFGYLVYTSIELYPNVLSGASIKRRLGVAGSTAQLLKRRLQLFFGDLKPTVKKQLLEQIKDNPLNMDTVALFSASQRANGFRARHKHKGQTSSIYLSSKTAEEKGKYQVGTLSHVMAVKGGAVLLDSIPDQKLKTIKPLLDFIPDNSEIHTDEGYSWLGRYYDNHSAVNHSARGKYGRFARNRWSKDGVHNQCAEGFHRVLKHSFISGYSYVRPEYSSMYLDEYAMIKTIRSGCDSKSGSVSSIYSLMRLLDCVECSMQIIRKMKTSRMSHTSMLRHGKNLPNFAQTE